MPDANLNFKPLSSLPYLDSGNHLSITPDYTSQLADRLDFARDVSAHLIASSGAKVRGVEPVVLTRFGSLVHCQMTVDIAPGASTRTILQIRKTPWTPWRNSYFFGHGYPSGAFFPLAVSVEGDFLNFIVYGATAGGICRWTGMWRTHEAWPTGTTPASGVVPA